MNGCAITGPVQVECPASVQVGEMTVLIEATEVRLGEDSPPSGSPDVPLPGEPVQSTEEGSAAAEAVAGEGFVQPALAPAAIAVDPGPVGEAPLQGRYTLVSELARGGMGRIYFGEDPQLKRNVAVKVSIVSAGAVDPRFSNEAEVLARLAHPNIVPIYHVGSDSEGRPFYSMKLIKGRTLQAVLNALREGDLSAQREYPPAALLTIFRKVCDAMMCAHSQGVLHRDLKPENIMVGEYGEVLVMDWGLAKVLGEREENTGAAGAQDAGDYGMTLEGEVMGTPQYMSPEQAQSMVADLDVRSDIYSLGGILYAILTLRPPVEGRSLNEVLTKVKNGEISSMVTRRGDGATVSSPAAMDREVPEALQAVTRKAMARDRSQRYESVEAFTADIEAYQNGFATSAEHAGLSRQLVLLIKRHRAVSALAGVLLASAFVFSLRLVASERASRANELKALEERAAALRASAQAQIALAQSEHHARNPQAMRRILDAVPEQFRDQHWSYLDAKLDTPVVSFDIPDAGVAAAFPCTAAPGCFLVAQKNGNVRFLDPVGGFGGPLFTIPDSMRDVVLAFFEGEGRAWLAVVTNRPFKLGNAGYAASLEVREVAGGKTVFKTGLSALCDAVDFSPQGNLLCLRKRRPADAALQMRNAHTGEILWEGGSPQTSSFKFTKNEDRVVYAIETGAPGFQTLDSWTGREVGAKVKGNGRVHSWQAGAEQAYAVWFYAERQFVRSTRTGDSSTAFEHTLSYPFAGVACRGERLYLAFRPSSEGRVVELLESSSGAVKDFIYLRGNFDLFVSHQERELLLCLSEKKALFYRWDFAQPAGEGLPDFRGDVLFPSENTVAVCSPKGDDKFLKIIDLAKPKSDLGGPFSVRVSTSFGNLASGMGFSTNRAQDLVLFRDGARPDECVVARIEPSGFREIARWKCGATAHLSPSGRWAWSGAQLYDAATGNSLRKCERESGRDTVLTRWVDETHVLELQAVQVKAGDDRVESRYNTYVLWDVETGKILSQLSEPRAVTFEVSPDGLWIGEGGIDGWLRIRSARTLEVHKEYKVHDQPVNRIAWHPSKPVVFTSSQRDLHVKAWNLRDGKILSSSRLWKFPVSLSVNPKGTMLYVVNWGAPVCFPLDFNDVSE